MRPVLRAVRTLGGLDVFDSIVAALTTMRKILPVSLSLVLLGGCVQHTFAPGPGLSSNDFGPDSARCRLFARGSQSGFAFGVSGSPKFVGAAMGGAALGYAISSAVERNQNFNDCMMARGWVVADGSAPTTDAAMGAKLLPIDQPAAPTAPPIVQAVTVSAPVVPASYSTPATRREMRVRAIDVTPAIASSENLDAPRGVAVIAVYSGGAASLAGVMTGDVILAFSGAPVTGVADMQRALDGIAPNSTVTATIWRNSAERSLAIQF
jgi:hypothetical protein